MIKFSILLIGIISSQKINLFGELFVGEVICGAVLVSNLRSIRLPRGGKSLITFLFVWFIAQSISDVINETEIIKALKGILVPAFVAVILLGLSTAFYKRYQYLPIYLIGVFIGMWISRASGNEYYALNYWKWGLGSSVALIFLTWIEFYSKRSHNYFLMGGAIAFVLICLANSSRSMAATMLISSLVVLLSSRLQLTFLYRAISSSPSGRIQLFVLILAVVFVLDRSLAFLFSFGPFLDLLSPQDANKFSIQASNQWGVLIGGRSELLVSLEAFFDSPIWGHGSWPENQYYTYARLDRLYDSGGLLHELSVAESNIRSFLIPTHSYLMGALVWGGFFAGLFWLKVLGLLLAGFLNKHVISSPLRVYILISLIWSILFSPFGADARWLSTVLLWVYLTLSVNSEINLGYRHENIDRNHLV